MRRKVPSSNFCQNSAFCLSGTQLCRLSNCDRFRCKDELSSIQEDVEIEDSLRAKLADLCNIIDRIDQKKLNTFSSCLDSKGSKMSLTNALKKGFPTQHSLINEIESILDMVFLARDFFIHRRNRSKTKLFDFYAISEESSPKEIWIKIYEKYEF